MKKLKFNKILILLFLFQISCNYEKIEIENSVYYWKNQVEINQANQEFLINHHVKHIYVKFFDVKTNFKKETIPVSEVNFKSDLSEFEIIPVVYITVDVFKNLDSFQIQKLSKNISDKINQLSPQSFHSEIQIDCDWTPSIKNKYFYFLEEFKKINPQSKLSATIRLYQYKYPNLAGIPPIDKGVLMYYNMGNVKEYEEENSILNNSKGQLYLGFQKYPIPLDFAIPNFSWSVLFRYKEFITILPTIEKKDFSNDEIFLVNEKNYFQVITDTVYKNTYLRFGDELRFETVSIIEISIALELLKNEFNQKNTRIIVFDFQDQSYKLETMEFIFNFFHSTQ